MSKSNIGMTDRDWKILFKSLKNNRCVICLGPGLYAPDNETRLEDEFLKHMRAQAEDLGIRVYDDGWIHFLQPSHVDTFEEVDEFYQQPRPVAEARLRLLSQIPFHFLISFIPDYKLKEAFEEQGFAHDFVSYIKNKPVTSSTEIEEPTNQRPLLFNMLGELEERNSLVLTHNDFYDYLGSVFEGKSMAEEYKEKIFDADYFIFLGIPFDRWYTHLFMRILKQHEQDLQRNSKQFAANVFLDEKIITQVNDQYTITFVPSDINDFLNELHQRCEAQGADFMRSKDNARLPQINYADLDKWMQKSEFKKIFDHLTSELAFGGAIGSSLLETVKSMSTQLEFDQFKSMKGELTSEQVRANSMTLLNKIREFIRVIQQSFPN